jgi:uncharacterized protein YuzE
MRIKYFTDTDTALIEFADRPIQETTEINENIYLDLDAQGNLVSMTIEHAKAQANLPELLFQQFEQGAA